MDTQTAKNFLTWWDSLPVGNHSPAEVERWIERARPFVSAARAAVMPRTDTRRVDWHYDSQGYCDNPGRGY